MINVPEWVTAGTAITAVLGGLFSVYTTTQSRMDVTDEKLLRSAELISQVSNNQRTFQDRILRNELGVLGLKEHQDRIEGQLVEMSAEVKQMNNLLIKIYAHHKDEK